MSEAESAAQTVHFWGCRGASQSYQDYLYSIDANSVYLQNHLARNELHQKTKSCSKSRDRHRADKKTGMRTREISSYSVCSTFAKREFFKETVG